MTMLEVFQELIDFCAQPAPSFAGDTHAIGFHLSTTSASDDPYEYWGITFLQPTPTSTNPFNLQGFGYTHPQPNYTATIDTPHLVRVALPIGRHNPVAGNLEFCTIRRNGGPGEVLRTELFDVTASRQSYGLQLMFNGGQSSRQAILFKTNVLRTF
jgi:hypothetical protein